MPHTKNKNGNRTKRSLAMLPDGVEKVFLRSDSAGYQVDLLKYCAEGHDEGFGVIDFAVAADVNAEFRKAALAADVEWKPLRPRHDAGATQEHQDEREQEYAEVAFVPSWIANGRKGAPEYRLLAIREPLRQLDLPHIAEPTFPFPTQEFQGAGRYKLFGMVTNRFEMPGDEVIWWHRKRCGNSEKAHAVMKDDLAHWAAAFSRFRRQRRVVDAHDRSDESQRHDEALGAG